ncbi:CBO0543 family protein [Alkalihalobacterium sp. APHAB7]|uniref:CBO0543 family protein n=1 Tax=Alkalihalobacterium sp. APHAB7 TaxID=3402081 RepID=UPI003AAC41FB
MSKDKGILLLSWVVTIVFLVLNVPRNRVKHAILAFLYKQMVTWLFGLLVVEKGLIKYPVRFFKKANKTSFSFEYFIYPALCAIFNMNYPEHKNRLLKFFYIMFHSGVVTFVEYLIERNTRLITYVKWKWYWSFVTMSLTYYSSRLFYRWYFIDEFSRGNVNSLNVPTGENFS